MPRLIDNTEMVQDQIGSFQFSGIRPDRLGATEYTLVTLVTDRTGSVSGFEKELLNCVKTSIDACKKSPRAENLLVRYVTFARDVTEEHGFIPLKTINVADYKAPTCTGMTALYDALYSSIGAANTYGKTLMDSNYNVNAITFVVTDGEDNSSKMGAREVKAELERAASSEMLESHLSVLIGINAAHSKTYLESVKNKAGLTQYIDAGDVTPSNLAKLAAFISKSISSQSSSLGSGGPSQPLTI